MAKKKGIKGRPKKARRGQGGRNWLYLIITAIMVVAIGVGATLVYGRNTPSPTSGSTPSPASGNLPAWVMAAPASVQQAYIYAAEHPETLSYIPCFCGCGAHSGHRSIHDCFIASRSAEGSVTSYDNHGANCDMCVDEALMTRDMLNRGKSLKEVRETVVAKYGDLGPSTDTPPIP